MFAPLFILGALIITNPVVLCLSRSSYSFRHTLATASTRVASNLTIFANPTLFGETAAVGDVYDVFGTYQNATNTTLHVIRVPSGEIISQAVDYTAYNYTKQPDVLISFDAQQAALYNINTVFSNFSLNNNQSLQPQLQLLHNISLYATKPYQYNIISLIYNEYKINVTDTYNVTFYNQSTYSNFTLATAFNSTYINNSIYDIRNWTLINPTIDDTGLGFLLWTISEFGDVQYNINGVSDEFTDWRYWWYKAFTYNISVIDSWTEAFNSYMDPTTDVGIMSSYGLDPAYNICQNYSNNIIPLVSRYNNTRYAWAEIIEMGVMQNSTQQQSAIDFVNYIFDNEQVQNQTIYQDWSMPASSNITIPQCYYDSGSVLPTQVNLYNIPLLQQIALNGTILNSWLDDWSSLQKNTYNISRLNSTYSLKAVLNAV